jgi:zinc transport system ATP-binding protein
LQVDALVQIDGVSFSYGATPVLRDVTLRVLPGEFVALAGPNGAGKSTLLRVLLGLEQPAAGSVRLFGVPPADLVDRHRLGYVPQRPSLAGGMVATVADIVASGRLTSGRWLGRRPLRERDAIDRSLASVGLLERRNDPIALLSGGQQQRAFIARAMAAEPDLLVLDEPVAGLDADSQRDFRDALVSMVERGGAVLLVSHELGAVADDLDRVVVLRGTVRFDGTPGELAETGVHLGVHGEDLPRWLEGVGF